MHRLTAPALLLLCLTLFVAACGGTNAAGPTDAPATDTPVATPAAETPIAQPDTPVAGTDLNACEIVTRGDIAEVAQLDTEAVKAGEFEATPTTLSPGHTECTYEFETGGVIVSLTPEDGANLYDAARGAYADASDIANHGGDGAFYSADNNRTFFWKGNVTVMFTIFLNDSSGKRTFAEELGRLAIAKV